MPIPLAEWPLILCGPMLRRVVGNSATVWVALSSERLVTLRVYEISSGFDGNGAASTRPAHKLIGSGRTRKLGKNLHVVCVTATGGTLDPRKLYCYDLEFGPSTATGPGNELSNNLFAEGLLGEAGDTRDYLIGYEPLLLPRFALPPDDIGHLRVFHGSCRKPHAPGTDALVTLDGIIKESLRKPLAQQPLERPHQLFLTGDQIYADDVATHLLSELTATGNMLLGWTDAADARKPRVETFPGIKPGTEVPVTDPSLAPSKRMEVVWQNKNNKKFTSSAAWNHLMSLGEFYAMYLFTWSRELWPEELPKSNEIFEHKGTYYNILDPVEGNVYRRLRGMTNSDFKKLKKRFQDEMKNIESFRATLPYVRRLLANIPTYMMFDDHEVTDDWYLDGEWTKSNLTASNALSRRIITNALTSFSIFQAWGNTPERFESGAGKKLLDAAELWNGTALPPFNDLSRCVGIDSMAHQVGVGAGQAPTASDRIQYHFNLEWSKHKAIVLDTRTWRSFGAGQGGAELISAASIQDQLQGLAPGSAIDVTLVVSPAPVLGVALLEDFVQPAAAELMGPYTADTEAWKTKQPAFQRLLRKLSTGKRVVLLSGDVHYGFTIRCQFWENKSGPAAAVYAQLTSSALKNECDELPTNTHMLHMEGYELFTLQTQEAEVFLGWENEASNVVLYPSIFKPHWYIANMVPIEYRSPMVALKPYVGKANMAPDWSYTLEFMSDPRPTGNPFNHPVPKVADSSSFSDRIKALRAYGDIADFHSKYLNQRGAGREVVGLNNIGEVTFERSPVKVCHRLWWRMLNSEPKPYTQHVVSLEPSGPQPTVPIQP